MIELKEISKIYSTKAGPITVLDNVSLSVAPGQRVGILGRNGEGKSTLVRLISGSERPTRGEVRRSMSVSWPLAFGGAFQGSLTGYDNLKFICRIYGIDAKSKLGFVEDFSELGIFLHEPVRTYSSGMKARLAFAISMSVDFDCYLIDEIIAVGDKRFHDKCVVELFEKRAERAKIIVSHDPGYIRNHCDSAAVLSGGKLKYFDELDPAFELYEEVSNRGTILH